MLYKGFDDTSQELCFNDYFYAQHLQRKSKYSQMRIGRKMHQTGEAMGATLSIMKVIPYHGNWRNRRRLHAPQLKLNTKVWPTPLPKHCGSPSYTNWVLQQENQLQSGGIYSMRAISLPKNPILHSSTKHVVVSYHFIREKVADGTLKVCHIPTKE